MSNDNTGNGKSEGSFPAVTESEIGGAFVQSVCLRSLHDFLQNGDHFATWIKDRVRLYGFTEGVDFVTYSVVSEKGGAPRKDYAATLDMAKELGMVERNDQGRQVRRYFIECERRAKEVPAFRIPQTLGEALRLAADQQDVIASQQAQIEADKPKTGFYDQFINADGLYNLQNAARALNCRPNLFTRWLKEKFMFYQGSALVPRVQYIQMGVFEVKSTIVEDKARPQAFITPRGLEYLSTRVPDHIRMGKAA